MSKYFHGGMYTGKPINIGGMLFAMPYLTYDEAADACIELKRITGDDYVPVFYSGAMGNKKFWVCKLIE